MHGNVVGVHGNVAVIGRRVYGKMWLWKVNITHK